MCVCSKEHLPFFYSFSFLFVLVIVFQTLKDLLSNLLLSPKTSLNFTWNEYQHCNTDGILIVYEYKLLRQSDYTYIYEGSETKTSISFNNLKPDTQYLYQVRVSVTSLVTGGSHSSSWVYAYEKTELVYGRLHVISVFVFCD